MNEEQSKLFREVLDLNWEMNKENKNFTRKFELATQLGEKKAELKASMGEAEYNKFMNAGQRMFAPKK
jgi:hypothetical protein